MITFSRDAGLAVGLAAVGEPGLRISSFASANASEQVARKESVRRGLFMGMMVDSIGHRMVWERIRLRLTIEATSLRPLAVHDGFRGELGGINNDVFHLLAFPRVGDVNEVVFRLNDRGIAELLLRLVFKNERGFPNLAVFAHGEIQRAAASGGVVVNEQVAAVGERDGVGAGVGIGQVGERNFAPGLAGVFGGDLEDFALLRATHGLQLVAAEEEKARLDGSDLQTVVQQLGAAPGFAEVGSALEVDGPRAGLRVGLVARGA